MHGSVLVICKFARDSETVYMYRHSNCKVPDWDCAIELAGCCCKQCKCREHLKTRECRDVQVGKLAHNGTTDVSDKATAPRIA